MESGTNLGSKGPLRPVEQPGYHLPCLIAIVINGLENPCPHQKTTIHHKKSLGFSRNPQIYF